MKKNRWEFSKYRSGEMINGIERSAHRALLYSTGMDKEDLEKPLIAVVNSFTEMVPGHIHLREIAEYVKQGIYEAGGVPREFNTIAICDGLCQGHIGMSYPLASRDLIADSVELMVEAHRLDGMVMLPGCDKVVPGMLMAAARLDIPAIVLPAGPMIAGNYKDIKDITLSSMRELIGRTQVGAMTDDELEAAEMASLPTYGTCSMMGTANSMCCLAEVLGMALPGAGTSLAVSSERRRQAKQSGRRIVVMVDEGLNARKIINRQSLLNGIAATMAMGASTNTVLHLMAIANEARAEITLDDFDKLSRRVPYICSIKPSGDYPLSAFHESGGVQAVMKAISSDLDLSCLTVSGATVGENLEKIEAVENEVIYSRDNPKDPEGGIAVLYGNLAPDGAVVKKSGVKPSMHYFRGSARVFHSMEDASAAVSGDLIKKGDVIVIRYEGPKGGPGMREMHMTTSLLVGRGMDESCALITDGRFSGSTRGPCIGHISPEAAAGGPIAAIEDGDIITIDIPGRKLTVELSAGEITERLSKLKHIIKPRTPALAKYAALVTSADKGAILKLPD